MRVICLMLCIGFVASNAHAGDWPMWRYDAGRGAASPEKLAKALHLQWVRELPKPRPAWPATQTKLRFDQSYEPVVMSTRMFVGSSADDSVRAYSTRDGKELWRYFTDGPVRFAPVAVGDRVYVTSDDGHLHCLNAADGKLVWKVNGGPAIRPIIGNHRLVSTWPARGGPVYADGTIYFAASIWPSMGIFVHAVDAKTGHIKWTNSKAGSLFVVHPHGAPAFGSVVPQGHLVINGDSLIVPGGRSSPAVFDRKTGELKYFKFNKRDGHHRVISRGDLYFVGGSRLRLQDGRGIDSANADVLTEDLVLASKSGTITATELNGKLSRTVGKDRRGRVRILYKYSAKTRWTLKVKGGAPMRAQLVAGDQIFTASKNRIASFPLPKSGTLESAANWSTEINGEVWSMLAADGRLFVVTVEGRVYCFGAQETAVRRHELHTRHRRNEDRIIGGAGVSTEMRLCGIPLRDSTKADPGFAIVYGLSAADQKLIRGLTLDAHAHIVAVDSAANSVRRFRNHMANEGDYGDRTTALVGNGVRYPLPPYMASYIISLNPKTAGIDFRKESLQSLYRSLRPYGGVACLKFDAADHAKFAKAVKAAGLANAEVTRKGNYTLLKRVGPLPKTAGWTHQYGDAANTVVSQDDLVKAPLGVLWFGGPSHDKILPRHGHGPNPQIAGGRLVIEGPDLLRAVDVYTGRLLWEKELKGLGAYYNTTRHFAGAGEVGTNYVTMPDAVYAVYGHRIIELDAATGKERKSFTLKAEPGKTPPSWGYAAVSGDYLIATSDPVKVAGTSDVSSTGKSPIPKGYNALIGVAAKWRYLAGKDAPAGWQKPGFDDAGWKTGKAGFGYGDGDDRTKLNMRGKYSRIYIRREFEAKRVADLILNVNFDDAFIAYLNGKEIARVGVRKGSGLNASGIKSHEAKGFESFPIANFKKLLRPGKNVLALEGHNAGSTSSDFSLDPVLVAKTGKSTVVAKKKPMGGKSKPAFEPVKYSSASKKIVVFDRKTGELLWQLEAKFNFRHNCVIATPPGPPLGKGGNRGMVFCIDGASPRKIQMLKRRGVDASGKAKLLALDIKTGKELWSADKDVFGTFLNYSKKHDVLLQAGSAYRDRAKDEVSRGMVAYNGTSGKVLWADRDVSYGGPCLLWRDKIITNGGGGYSLELLTGKKTGWSYSRMYGCNTAVGSKNLLTFRSGAAGFYDLTGDSGTGNIGGFRSSCTSNLIAADGVLNAPDYTRTCTCAYQNQTSLALIHMPENDFWTFNRRGLEPTDAKRIGFNLGAPGDRRAKNGTLWFDAPSVGGPSPGISVKVEPESAKWFRRHSSYLTAGDTKWIAASGVSGLRTLTIQLGDKAKSTKPCTVRLHFAVHQAEKAGERVFTIRIQGKEVAGSLDVFKTAGGKNRQLVREFRNVSINGTLKIEFTPSSGSKYPPLVCGVEIERQ